MEDYPQPANVEQHEQAQNVEDPPQPLNVEDAPQPVNVEEPPQQVNVEDQQPPVNGHVLAVPYGPDDHQFLLAPNQIPLLDLENHFGDVANLGELIIRHDEPPMDMEEIRELLDVIGHVDDDEEEEEANAPNGPEICNSVDEEPGENHHDDSDDEPDIEALAAMIYKIGMMKNN